MSYCTSAVSVPPDATVLDIVVLRSSPIVLQKNCVPVLGSPTCVSFFLSGSTTNTAWSFLDAESFGPSLNSFFWPADATPYKAPPAQDGQPSQPSWNFSQAPMSVGASPMPSGPPSPMLAPELMRVQKAVEFSAPPVFPEVS